MGSLSVLLFLLLISPMMNGKHISKGSTMKGEKQDADQTDVMLELQKLWKNQQKQEEELELLKKQKQQQELKIQQLSQENKEQKLVNKQVIEELEAVKLQNQQQQQVNKQVMKELEKNKQVPQLNQENKELVGELEMVRLQNQEQKLANKQVIQELESVKLHSQESRRALRKVTEELKSMKQYHQEVCEDLTSFKNHNEDLWQALGEVMEEVKSIKQHNQEEKETNKKVFKELASLKVHNQTLEEQNDELKREIQQLKSLQLGLKDELHFSKSQLNGEGNQQLRQSVGSTEKVVQQQWKEETSKGINDFANLSEKSSATVSSSIVGFTATGKHETTDYEDGEIIIFDVVLQEAPQYDPATSVFTCDQAGLYYFSAHIMFRRMSTETYQTIDMYHNSAKLTTAFGPYSSTYPALYSVSSTSAVIYLQVADQVFLRANGQVRVQSSGKQSSFSGFLISTV